MKKIFLLWFFIITSFSVCYAAEPVIDIVANVGGQETFSYVSATVPSILQGNGTITPEGSFSNDINDACWKVVDPIVITLSVKTNFPTAKLVIYTKHKEQTTDYWNTAATAALPSSVTINGLINTTNINSDNWYNSTVSLRAYADVFNNGLSTDNTKWSAWVNDISGQSGYANAGVLNTGDLDNSALKVYVRSCWNTGKVAGAYKGKIFFTLTSQ
ncbi:MAG: hypothetical protein WC860_01060 [Candidatus Margulisiibacteriota bacterium]